MRILQWLRNLGVPWIGSKDARSTPPERALSSERIRANLASVMGRVWFLPFQDNLTGETEEMRLAYRQMLKEPTVKAGVLQKLLAVASLDLSVQAASDKPHDKMAAEFLDYSLNRIRGGVRGMVESILFPGLVEGYSLSEKVWQYEERSKWQGKYTLQALKAKDSETYTLQGDEYRNVTNIYGLQYNAGIDYNPANFVLWQHLPIFEAPFGMSDLRAAYRAYWLIDASWKWRARYLEKFATPVLIGQYEHENDKAPLENALEQAKSATWMCVPESAKVETLELASRGDEAYASAIKDLRHEIMLGVTGAILQALEGNTTGARSIGEVHKDSAELLVWHLAKCLTDTLQDQVVPDLMDLNFVGLDYPTVTLSGVDDQQMLPSTQVDSALLSMGLTLSKAELRKKYGRAEPLNEEDELKPPQQPDPTGGSMEGLSGMMDGEDPAGGWGFAENEEDWDGYSEADWERFDEGDWAPWTLMRGPNKGKVVWKHKRTGRISHTDPSKKKAEQDDKKASKKKENKENKAAKQEEILSRLKEAREKGITPEDSKALLEEMKGLTVAQLNAIKKDLGVKASGKKADLAQKIRDRAIEKQGDLDTMPREKMDVMADLLGIESKGKDDEALREEIRGAVSKWVDGKGASGRDEPKPDPEPEKPAPAAGNGPKSLYPGNTPDEHLDFLGGTLFENRPAYEVAGKVNRWFKEKLDAVPAYSDPKQLGEDMLREMYGKYENMSTIGDLHEAMQESHPGVTLPQVQKHLREMYERGEVRLGEWTSPAYRLKSETRGTEAVMFVNSELRLFVQPGENAKRPPAKPEPTPAPKATKKPEEPKRKRKAKKPEAAPKPKRTKKPEEPKAGSKPKQEPEPTPKLAEPPEIPSALDRAVGGFEADIGGLLYNQIRKEPAYIERYLGERGRLEKWIEQVGAHAADGVEGAQEVLDHLKDQLAKTDQIAEAKERAPKPEPEKKDPGETALDAFRMHLDESTYGGKVGLIKGHEFHTAIKRAIPDITPDQYRALAIKLWEGQAAEMHILNEAHMLEPGTEETAIEKDGAIYNFARIKDADKFKAAISEYAADPSKLDELEAPPSWGDFQRDVAAGKVGLDGKRKKGKK